MQTLSFWNFHMDNVIQFPKNVYKKRKKAVSFDTVFLIEFITSDDRDIFIDDIEDLEKIMRFIRDNKILLKEEIE